MNHSNLQQFRGRIASGFEHVSREAENSRGRPMDVILLDIRSLSFNARSPTQSFDFVKSLSSGRITNTILVDDFVLRGYLLSRSEIPALDLGDNIPADAKVLWDASLSRHDSIVRSGEQNLNALSKPTLPS